MRDKKKNHKNFAELCDIRKTKKEKLIFSHIIVTEAAKFYELIEK